SRLGRISFSLEGEPILAIWARRSCASTDADDRLDHLDRFQWPALWTDNNVTRRPTTLGSRTDARLSRRVAGPRRSASCGLRVLGGGHNHRVRPGVHGRLVPSHQPTHHVWRRAVFSAHPDDLRMLIVPFGGRAFHDEEVADPGLHRPLPSVEVMRSAGPFPSCAPSSLNGSVEWAQ